MYNNMKENDTQYLYQRLFQVPYVLIQALGTVLIRAVALCVHCEVHYVIVH